MRSIHLYLSNTVKNPCSKTNWHSPVVYCEEIVTGMDDWEDKPTRRSDPNPARSSGMDFDWSGDKWAGFPPACRLASQWLNLVNFHRARPCHSLMEYTCGYCCCCRSSPLSLRWANVDPPVELKADHTFLHLQGDCLSLQWLRTPLGQTNTSFLHPLDSHKTLSSDGCLGLYILVQKSASCLSNSNMTLPGRDRWKLWPTCPLTITICDGKVTTCLWDLATNVTWW